MRDTPVRDCIFCGHHFLEYLGKYRGAGRDCTNCQADETLQVTVLDDLVELPRARWQKPPVGQSPENEEITP